ncbi:MAG: transcription termination/antitermination protein NusG [Chloroflexota bacterium]
MVTEQATQAAPDAESDSAKNENVKWYVIHTYSGYENKVKTNLEHRIQSMDVAHKIFRVVVPTEEEVEIKNGQRRTVQKKIFPGYVLVEQLLDDESWFVVRNPPGVTSFVGHGNNPTPLPDSEVQAILKQMREEKPQVRITYNKGDRVKIIDGPFAEFLGTIDGVDDEKTKLRVLVSMFGRETPVELDFLQVEKA